jgi:hypothetical protein
LTDYYLALLGAVTEDDEDEDCNNSDDSCVNGETEDTAAAKDDDKAMNKSWPLPPALNGNLLDHMEAEAENIETGIEVLIKETNDDECVVDDEEAKSLKSEASCKPTFFLWCQAQNRPSEYRMASSIARNVLICQNTCIQRNLQK